MRAILLGTGNGKADPERYSPSSVVWLGGEPVLVDCGAGAVVRLRGAGLAPSDIRTVLITHLHFDHYSDWPYLAIEPLVGEGAFERGSLGVFGPPGSIRLARDLERAYDVELDSYASLRGYERVREAFRSDVTEISDGWTMERHGHRITAAQVDHGVVALPCFAFRIDAPDGRSIVFGGDSVPCDAMIELARGADVLVHECNFPDEEVETRKRLGWAWRIHSTPSDAGRVAAAAGVRKLVLNHLVGWNDFSPNRDPYIWQEIAPPVIREYFDGEVVIGADLMAIEI